MTRISNKQKKIRDKFLDLQKGMKNVYDSRLPTQELLMKKVWELFIELKIDVFDLMI